MPGDVPVMGDWNGDGRLKVGVFRKGAWLVDWNGNYRWDATDAAHVFSFGAAGDLPVIGDWNGDGRLKMGVFRKGEWFVDWNGNNRWDTTDGTHVFRFGKPDDLPVITAQDKNPFTAAFKDSLVHAAVWENTSAKTRAYIAPHTRLVRTWEEAQDRFGALSDLRDMAFVEEPTACASTAEFPAAAGSRIAGMNIAANRVELDVEASTPGLLVITDAYMPGWEASVDGRRQTVVRVNGTFRGTCLEQRGKHRVVMSYRPPHWFAAVSLSGLGFAGLIAFTFMRKNSGS